MSLINEALKKAQAQRQSAAPGESPTSAQPGAPGASMPSPTAGPSNLWPVLFAIAGIALLFAAGAGLIVWGLMRPVAPATPTAEVSLEKGSDSTSEASDPLPGPTAEAVQPTRTAAPAAATPDSSIPASTIAETASVAKSVPSEEPSSPAQSTPPSTTEAAPIPEAASPAKPSVPNPAVEAFVTRLEVRGIMSGGQKALLFNHLTQRSEAYISGSTVSNELQLKIQSITERSITFVDHDGHVYTKQF